MSNKKDNSLHTPNEIMFYETDDGKVAIEVRFENENAWLSQKHMAELFGCSVDNVSRHLKNIYTNGELDQNSTTEEFSIVGQEGNRLIRRNVKFYNLEVVISVGYRVNSARGVMFRTWATDKLIEASRRCTDEAA